MCKFTSHFFDLSVCFAGNLLVIRAEDTDQNDSDQSVNENDTIENDNFVLVEFEAAFFNNFDETRYSPVEHTDQNDKPYRKVEQVVHKPVEVLVVPFTETSPKPIAVMIELQNAYTALRAVESPCWPEDSASLTELESEQMALSMVIDLQVADCVDRSEGE